MLFSNKCLVFAIISVVLFLLLKNAVGIFLVDGVEK